MKKVLASLLAAYVLTNGQAPPSGIVDQPTAITPVDVVPNTVTEPGTTAAATTQLTQVSISSASTAPAPPSATTASRITTQAATTAAATTAAATTAAATTQAGAAAPQTGIVPPTGATSAPQTIVSTTARATTTAGSATTASPATGTTAASGSTTAAGSSATTQAPGTTTSASATPGTTQAAAAPGTTTSAPAPVTTTAKPAVAPTLNPYCPLDAGLQSGFDPQSVQFNENAVCFQPTEIATDYLGRLRCDNFACCQCAQINCGFNGYPCETLQLGDSGAVGVQSINIRGAPGFNNNPMQSMFGGGFSQNGAKLECNGRESCLGTVIRAEMLSEAQCSGDMGCQGAKIVINDPMPMMNTQCNGLSSCSSVDIEINVGIAEAAARAPGQACNPAYSGGITELGKIEFNGQWAGSNAKVTINHQGCGTLLFDAFECMSNEACPGINVNIQGNIANVAIRHCDLRGVAPTNVPQLVAACQAGQRYGGFSPGFGGPTFPIPGQPTFPIVPSPPVIPPNPVNPNPNPVVPSPPTLPVPSPPVPVNPTPVIPGFGIRDPRATKLQCDQLGMPVMGMNLANPRACAGTTQTIQIANGFVLDCSLAGACNGMTLTLNAGRDPNNPMFPVTYIDSLKFVKATSGVTVYINNEFGASGAPVRINDIRCEMPGSCSNLKVIAGPGVDILSTNYDCSAITSCIGATVQQGSISFAMDPRTQGMGVGASPFPQQPQTFNSFPGQQQQPSIPFNPWI